MATSTRTVISLFSLGLLCASQIARVEAADLPSLANVRTPADLDALIAATPDDAMKRALRDDAAAVLAAAEARPHVEAVTAAVEGAKGKVERINRTPPDLKKAAGAELPLFETLRLVDLSVPNTGPHDARETDPYDAAFFEHLGHVKSLESLYVIATKCNDQWVAPLGRLANLKSLRLVNNGKLTDAGLEHLAGLRNLESFGYVGTQMQGHSLAKFDTWRNLRTATFRGSSIDDEGVRLICERFPNLETLVLAHAKFTDAATVHLEKLTRLKGLELGTKNATAKSLEHVRGLPLEYLQLGEGFEGGDAVRAIAGVSTLRRLTLTDAKDLTDDDLKAVAGMTQLQSLELNNLPRPDERLPQLKAFTFLKTLRLVRRPQPNPPETQAKIKSVLPGTTVTFE